MTSGKVVDAYQKRLATSVTSTVVGDNTTKTIPVDAFVVHFDEDGGSFEHMPTGDIYSYSAADSDLETVTLTSGLPVGKTLSADDALRVVSTEDGDDATFVRADDLYVNVAIDDVPTDTIPVRVPREFREQIKEGNRKLQKGDSVEVEADDDEWVVTRRKGQPEPGPWFPGALVPCAAGVAGGGALLFRQWLKCDGSTISRAKYPDLFNAIGTQFGSTSATNFKLPDLVGRTIFGAGSAVSLGGTDGVTNPANRGPGHDHAIFGGAHQHGIDPTSHNGTANADFPLTGGRNVVQTVNGTVGTSHAHGGNTNFDGGGGHNHTGFTGSGLGSTNVLGFIGIHYLIHI